MATRKLTYASSSAVTITLASLATSSTLLVGVEATLVDNTSNLYLDYHLTGKIKAGTSPTTGKVIEVHAVAMNDDSTWSDAFTGSNSARTITTADIKAAVCRVAAVMQTDATTGRVYYFGPVSVAELFGGVCPAKFTVFVTHSTAVNLDSTGGNHSITVKGVYETVA